MSNPCLACGSDIRPRQHRVECDWCSRSQHRMCGTGVSVETFRMAMKNGGLTYVCRPCLHAELRSRDEPPQLEETVPATDDSAVFYDEPPQLELTIPTTEEPTIIYDDPPQLELSMPATEESTVIYDEDFSSPHRQVNLPDVTYTVRHDTLPDEMGTDHDRTFEALDQSQIPDEEVYVQTSSMEVQDIDEDMTPLADSTAIDDDGGFSSDDSQDFPPITPFNIVDRNLAPKHGPVQASFLLALTETVLEDRGKTFTILDQGGQRSSRVLVSSDGYAYGVKRENKSSTVWRCTSRSKAVRCPVMVRQEGDTYVQIHEHVHPGVPDRDTKMNVYAKVKQAARTAVFEPALTIAEKVLLDHERPGVARPKKALLKRAVNRARAQLRPQEPRTLDFEIDGEFIDAETFLVDDIKMPGGQRHFVFATQYQLQLLKHARRWYIDGTFKIVGEPFRSQGQLFSIHAFIERDGQSKQLPLVCALMSRRTKADYVAVFRAVVDALGDYRVQGFMADYEIAAWQAVREVFPMVDVKGCAFHWSQAIWRHVQSVGLAETYRRRSELRRYVRMLFGLQFLPADHIPQAFGFLEDLATTDATCGLVSYIRRQWMSHSVFRVEDWSVYQQDVRTNNDLEGWHNRMNRKAGGLGLAFYRLVPLLRREAELVRMSVESGDLERAISTNSKKTNAAIKELWTDYADGTITTSSFLQKIGDVYVLH